MSVEGLKGLRRYVLFFGGRCGGCDCCNLLRGTGGARGGEDKRGRGRRGFVGLQKMVVGFVIGVGGGYASRRRTIVAKTTTYRPVGAPKFGDSVGGEELFVLYGS